MRLALALVALSFLSVSRLSVAVDIEPEPVVTTVEKLEELASKGKWSEVIFGLRDVAPGARGKKWDSLVERASIGYVTFLQGTGASGAEHMASSLIKEYPSLQRSPGFLKLKKEVGLKAFEACFDRVFDDQDCQGRFLAYVEETPGDAAFAIEAAELVSRKEAPAASLPFRKTAIRWSSPAKVCKEVGTRNAILAALRLPEGPWLALGRELASKACAKEAKEEIDSEFEKTAKGSFVANACEVFKARGDAPASAAKRCVVKKK